MIDHDQLSRAGDREMKRMAEERDELVRQAEAILTRTADSQLDGDELAEFERLEAQIKALNERHEKFAEINRLAARGHLHYESGGPDPVPQFQKRVDAWEQP